MEYNTSMQLGLTEWILLIVLSILWGGSFFLGKVAVSEVPPFTLVFFRVSLAALTLLAYLKISHHSIPIGLKVWGAFFMMDLINNFIPFSLIFWGQTQIGSGLASILNATTPIFTVLVAHLFTQDERLNGHRIAGVVLGFAGVTVMLSSVAGENSEYPPAAMLAYLGTALSYGFASVFGRRFYVMNIGPSRAAFGNYLPHP